MPRESIRLVLYSKPGCHLCEGLEEKLAALPGYEVEIRNITTRSDWFQAYQYEIPVLCYPVATSSGVRDYPLPRLSPRASAVQVDRMIQKHIDQVKAE